jgi:hypothetical protein
MESRDAARMPRSREFLDTVAFGSLLVFASVMPPLPPAAPAPHGHAVTIDTATRPECPEQRTP